ncbi:MAG: ABC transporter ATP-binding protein [Bacilli bacterium]|jgi:branched-chain amino acid transport system ATP-binding protein
MKENRKIVLETKDLEINFGGLQAVKELNMKIYEKELVGLIGPNGAGKTTVFNLITGVYKATSGSIYLCGESILNKLTHERVKKGITRTFQNIRLFKNLTVLDNVKVACNINMKYSMLAGVFRLPSYWKEEAMVEKKALDILKVFGLEGYAKQLASNLPYGKQRKLEIARALASDPKIILLDEPAAGMNPTETQELMETISIIRDKFNVTILLIEHDMKLVMGICERIYVLNYGELIASGTPKEVAHNEKVITAYLGTGEI